MVHASLKTSLNRPVTWISAGVLFSQDIRGRKTFKPNVLILFKPFVSMATVLFFFNAFVQKMDQFAGR